MKRFLLHRRTLLRGAFGGTMALPLLEPMLDWAKKTHGAYAAVEPKRFFLAFCGMSVGADGDPENNEVAPATTGPGYDASSRIAIAPLAKDELSKSVSIVSGLNIPMFTGAKGQVATTFHGGNASPLLSGVPAPDNAATVYGITSDQVVANAIGKDAKFPSLQVCVQPSIYSGGPYNGWIMSWSGSKQPLKPLVSPALLYRTLFMGFQAPTDAAGMAAFERDKKTRLRILDATKVSRDRLAKRLGKSDLQVLDEYYSNVQAIEAGLSDLQAWQAAAGCVKPMDPGDDPAVGKNTDSSMENMGVAPPGTGWSNETLRAQIFNNLIAAAFKCDLTRVATMVITRNQCFMAARNILDDSFTTDVHSLSHFTKGGKPSTKTLSRAAAWHVGIFGDLVKLLRDSKDATGKSLLASSALGLTFEGGHGSNPNDVVKNNTAHSTYNMCMLVAGGAGGLRQGAHVVAPKGADHPVNVLITLMNAVGVPAAQLGEISGAMPGLTG